MEIVTEFIGHSHCKIFLCKDKNKYFVRKETDEKDYIKRLKAQIDKQRLLSNCINAPRIFSEHKDSNKFYADMEYVNGENLINYLARCTDYKEIIALIDNVVNDIKCLKKAKFIGKNRFYDSVKVKLDSLKNKARGLDEVFSIMYTFLESNCKIEMKETACHGDLTFENVLISKNKEIFYIDFLDSFFSHYWFDFSKIYQDLEGEWFNIKNPELAITKEKLIFMKDYLDNQIDLIDPEYFRYHYFLLTLTFLRILPYANNPDIFKRVTEKVKLFSEKINSKNI